jgi:hypothetical protein
MIDEQKRLLDRRLRQALEQQPEIRVLRRTLLDIGGIELVAPPWPDVDVPLLIKVGFVMAGPVHCEARGKSACHENVSRLWISKRPEVAGIGTGYALSGDRLWRQHSWLTLREGILETTRERAIYFGILLQGPPADSFAESNR